MQGPHIRLQVLLPVIQDARSPQVVAGTDTAAAEHAAVHVVVDERVGAVLFEALHTGLHPGARAPKVLHQGLQLTASVFRAGGAVLRMPCQQKLQRHGAQLR